MKGINLLQKHGIDFSILSVLTSESLNYPDEIYSYFSNLNVKSIAFNVEESDGINTSLMFERKNLRGEYRAFMQRIYDLNADKKMKIRELEQTVNLIMSEPYARTFTFNINHPFSIVSVDTDGNASTFSPELLGIKNDEYNSFILGNLITDNLDKLTDSLVFKDLWNQIENGILRCQNECEYFSFCGGGSPSNKFGEHKKFNVSTTRYCELNYKELIDLVMERMEKKYELIN